MLESNHDIFFHSVDLPYNHVLHFVTRIKNRFTSQVQAYLGVIFIFPPFFLLLVLHFWLILNQNSETSFCFNICGFPDLLKMLKDFHFIQILSILEIYSHHKLQFPQGSLARSQTVKLVEMWRKHTQKSPDLLFLGHRLIEKMILKKGFQASNSTSSCPPWTLIQCIKFCFLSAIANCQIALHFV